MRTSAHEPGAPVGVFVVGAGGAANDVRAQLGATDEIEVLGATGTVKEAAESLAAWDVDVVLYATEGPSLALDEITHLREHTAAPVIVVAPATATGVLVGALEAEAADALLLPQPPEALLFAVRKAAGSRRAAKSTADGSRIVTVFSPKGGTGKTAIAANLALAISGTGRRTLLVDLDLQFGDCAIVLGPEPARTIHELATAPGEIDVEKLTGYVTRHGSSLDLLAAPNHPEEAELVPVNRVARLLEIAREAYDVTVIDTSPFLHGPTLAALDHSDVLVLVASLDVPTLKDVRQSLRTLELIDFPAERLALTLNRATAQVGISPAEVENALGMRFRYGLPDDRDVALAVNRGNPVVLSEPAAPFAQAIREMATSLLASRPAAARQAVGAGRV